MRSLKCRLVTRVGLSLVILLFAGFGAVVSHSAYGAEQGAMADSLAGAGAEATKKSAQGGEAAKELEAAVEKVQAAYTRIETLRADFSQSSRLAAGAAPRKDKGTVELKKGGKMRWDFAAPSKRQFISDGKTLWIYSPDDKQVIQSSLQSGASKTALNFMFGLGNLRQDFDVEPANEAEFQKEGATAIHLLPKEAIGTLKKLTILVSSSDGLVRDAFVHDHMGSITHVNFSGLKINESIDDSRFAFQIPEGTDVIQPQGF